MSDIITLKTEPIELSDTELDAVAAGGLVNVNNVLNHDQILNNSLNNDLNNNKIVVDVL